MTAPRIYDIRLDDMRDATQLDMDILGLCQIALGKVWLAREQELDYNSLIDRLEEIYQETRARAVRLTEKAANESTRPD